MNNESMDTSHTVVNNSIIDNTSVISLNIVKNKTISEYSSKWKSMIGNQFMSDITIFTKDECEIPAHSLVFHVQCPNILDDIITEESNTCKTKKMIMWLEYSFKACWAFLELIYSGQESFLNPNYRNDYLHLGAKYNILMAINDNENHGWFGKEEENVSKRKSTELFNSPVDCKKYKASSPDMFLSDNDMSPFLGITVNDEKSLSMMKTKQWLNDCNTSQHYNSSFTENLAISVPQETSLSENSPTHSFHSASTISLPLTSISEKNAQEKIECINVFDFINSSPTSLLTDKSSIKMIQKPCKVKSISNASISLVDITTLKKSCKEPEVITINSDSESFDMDITIKNNENNVTLLPQLNIQNEKKYDSFKKNNLNTMGTTIIDLSDDDSLNSIHSASTNILNKRNQNSKLNHSLFHDLSVLNPTISTTINNEDGNSVFSAVTNLLRTDNFNIQRASFNDIIHLDDNSSDSGNMSSLLKTDSLSTSIPNIAHNNGSNIVHPSTSFSNDLSSKQTNLTMNLTNNNSPSKSNILSDFEFSNSNILPINNKLKSIEDFDFNSKIIHVDKNNQNLLLKSPNKSFQNKNISTFMISKSCTQINNIEYNDNKNDRLCFNEKNILNKSYLDSNILEKKLKSPNNYAEDKTIKKYFDSTSECINKQTSIKPISTQIEPMKSYEINNISQTVPNENNLQDHLEFEQIIEDPWMDYNNWHWQSINISPRHVSPGISDNCSAVYINETEQQQTPKKNSVCHINLNSQTPTISNTQKINAITPNKYGSKIKTPKSLRRVQSESIIGSKEQITPLPDYSAMKTPDLRVSLIIFIYYLIINL